MKIYFLFFVFLIALSLVSAKPKAKAKAKPEAKPKAKPEAKPKAKPQFLVDPSKDYTSCYPAYKCGAIVGYGGYDCYDKYCTHKGYGKYGGHDGYGKYGGYTGYDKHKDYTGSYDIDP